MDELACFERGKALTKGLCLGLWLLLLIVKETRINAAPLNSANEMSALLNTRLMASPERCSLSERADNSITAGLDLSRGCCFLGEELALPGLPLTLSFASCPLPELWLGLELV